MAKKSAVKSDGKKNELFSPEKITSQEKKRNLLFKFLVVTLALLIFAAYALTLKNSWQIKKNQQNTQPVANEIKQDLNETINELKERVKELEEEQQIEQGMKDFVDNLKEEINYDDIVNPNLPTDEIAKPSPEPNNIPPGCPAWVNCMPTIGGPVAPCVIPPGCEGYTQLVY